MTLPAKEQYQPRSAASPTRWGAEKQCRITGRPSASRVEGGEDLVDRRRSRPRGRGRGSRSAGRARGRSRSGPRRRAAGPRARRCRGRSRARSRRSPAPSRAGAERGDLRGRGVVEAGGVVRVAADRGEDGLVALGARRSPRRWSPRRGRRRASAAPRPRRPRRPARPRCRRRGRGGCGNRSSGRVSLSSVGWLSAPDSWPDARSSRPSSSGRRRQAPTRQRSTPAWSVVVLENREYEDVIGNPEAPYLNRLAERGAVATHFYGVAHPSLPNYLALFAGYDLRDRRELHRLRRLRPEPRRRSSRAPASPGAPTWRACPLACFTAASRLRPLRETPQPVRLLPLGHGGAEALQPGRPGDPAPRRPRPPSPAAASSGSPPTSATTGTTAPCDAVDWHLWLLLPRVIHQLGPHGLLVVTFDEGISDAGCCGGPGGGRIPTVLVGPDVRHGRQIRLTREPLLAAGEHRGPLRPAATAQRRHGIAARAGAVQGDGLAFGARCRTPPTTTARSTSAGSAARRRRSRFPSPSWSAQAKRRWTRERPTTSAPGPGSEDTMGANAEAFRRRRIVPRMLRDVAERDLSTTVLGTAMPAPLMLAPIGVQKVVHEEGELASARAAAAVGVPMIASTASHFTLEEIAEAGGGAPRWFQLYWPNDRGLAASFVEPRRAGRLRRHRPHRRHLRPRLEAARPAAGLAALPQRHGRRQLLPGPGLPRRPGEDAGGGRGRRHRPLPRRPGQPRAELGRPRAGCAS